VAVMLTEPVILERLKRYLRRYGYTNIRVIHGRKHGDDLRATAPNGKFTLHVEAKGETSSHENSRRYGEPFNHAQVRDHMGTAIYKALCMRSAATWKDRRRIALALPDIPVKRHVYRPVARALRQLRIGVFWVGNRKITLEAPWPLGPRRQG
jgi:hypothetical protein